MICPNCSAGEISPLTNRCELCGFAPEQPAADVAPADTLDAYVREELAERFRVEARTESGATSASYRVRERDSERTLVVKVQLRPSGGDAESDQRLKDAMGLVAGLEQRRGGPVVESGWTAHLSWQAAEPPGRHPVRDALHALGPAVALAWQRIVAGTATVLDHVHARSRGLVSDQSGSVGAETPGGEPEIERTEETDDGHVPVDSAPSERSGDAAMSRPPAHEARPEARGGEEPGAAPPGRDAHAGGPGRGRVEPQRGLGGATDRGHGVDIAVVCPSCATGLISPTTHRCQLCGFAPEGGARVDAATAEEMDQLAHEELGELFRLDAPLGHGRATAVYLARGRHSDRQIVVKVLPRPAELRPLRDERFRHAIEQVAGLEHPHIVPVFEHGWTEHLYWYSMEHVRGWSLRTFLQARGRLDLKACLRVVAQVASALDHAHRRGIVHGALKPTNVLIDADGWVHVADLLVGRAIEIPPPPSPPARPAEAATPDGTAPAPVEAAPRTPAPERPPHAAPEDLWTPAADQYALAVLVAECLEGVPLDEGSAAAAPFTPALEHVPRQVRRVILRGLSRKPVDRFTSVLDFVAALELPADAVPEAVPSRPSSTVVLKESDWEAAARPLGRRLAIGALLALAVAGVLWQGPALVRLAGRLVGRNGPFAFVPLGTDSSLTGDQIGATGRGPARSRSGSPSARPGPELQPPQPVSTPQGFLFVNSLPWGQLYVDGHLVGNTPRAHLGVAQGTHTIRIVREGFVPYQQTVDVAAGAVVRMTTIVLTPVARQQP